MSTADVWAVVFTPRLRRALDHRSGPAYAGWQRVALLKATGVDPRYEEYYGGALHIACMGGAGGLHGMDGGGLWGIVSTGGGSTIGDIELLEFRMPLHLQAARVAAGFGLSRPRGALGATSSSRSPTMPSSRTWATARPSAATAGRRIALD